MKHPIRKVLLPTQLKLTRELAQEIWSRFLEICFLPRCLLLLCAYYGNTGYGVSSPGIQNLKDFCLKINIPKGNYWISRFAHCSGSAWPFDQAYLLMHSRYARNLYDPKIKRIFEIAHVDFEIIIFIHFYPYK